MARPKRIETDVSNIPIGFEEHDHSLCVQTTLDVADKTCAQAGLRLTAVRRKTLEILVQEHRALGAYEILEKLREEGFGSQPPVAYRAIEFLVKNGFVHKVEKLNAFVACNKPRKPHAPTFMICRSCQLVVETVSSEVSSMLSKSANKLGFRLEKSVVEVEGTCSSCLERFSA